MNTNLENLLNQDEFEKLINAINKNQEYYLSNNGFTIKAISSDDSLNLLINYDRLKNEDFLVKQETENFQKYLESLDDDVFIGVCEYLGKVNINKLQECLNSNNLESIRAAKIKFKNALSNYAEKQVNYWKQYVKSNTAN